MAYFIPSPPPPCLTRLYGNWWQLIWALQGLIPQTHIQINAERWPTPFWTIQVVAHTHTHIHNEPTPNTRHWSSVLEIISVYVWRVCMRCVPRVWCLHCGSPGGGFFPLSASNYVSKNTPTPMCSLQCSENVTWMFWKKFQAYILQTYVQDFFFPVCLFLLSIIQRKQERVTSKWQDESENTQKKKPPIFSTENNA